MVEEGVRRAAMLEESCVCVRFQEFFEVGAECKRLYEYEYEETYTLRLMGRKF